MKVQRTLSHCFCFQEQLMIPIQPNYEFPFINILYEGKMGETLFFKGKQYFCMYMFRANKQHHLQGWNIFTLLSIIQNNKLSPADFSHCRMQIAYKRPQGVRRHLSNTCSHTNYAINYTILNILRIKRYQQTCFLWL